MAYFLPFPWMHVIQPITHSAHGERTTVTYAIRVDSENGLAAVWEADIHFRDAWRSFLDTQATMHPAEGYMYTPGGELTVSTSVEGPQAGQANISSFPPNVAWLLRKRTDFVGRNMRGRMYFPWSLSETGADEAGMLTSSAISSRQAAATSWLADAAGASDYLGLWLLHSEQSNQVPTRLTSLVVGPQVATQRRRLGRVA